MKRVFVLLLLVLLSPASSTTKGIAQKLMRTCVSANTFDSRCNEGDFDLYFYSQLDKDCSVLTGVVLGHERRLFQEETLRREITTAADLREALIVITSGEILSITSDRIQLQDTLFLNVSDIVLRGRENAPTILECPNGGTTSAINITGDSVLLENLKFRNCTQTSAVVIDGGVVSNQDQGNLSVSFNQVAFVDNGVEGSQVLGAGVHITSCSASNCIKPSVQITSSQFERNRGRAGSAIFCENCNLDISDCVFDENEAWFGGGALYLQGTASSLNLVRSNFKNNSVDGAVLDSFEDPVFENRGVAGLRPEEHGTGGAIKASRISSLQIQDCRFIDNRGCRGGGALDIQAAGLIIGSVRFLLYINSTLFRRNSAFCSQDLAPRFTNELGSSISSGGALFYKSIGNLDLQWTIQGSTFRRNYAATGGAIYIQSSPGQVHKISTTKLTRNEAVIRGGGAFVTGTQVVLTGVIIRDNLAGNGGGLAAYYGSHIISQLLNQTSNFSTLFYRNKAIYGGGMYYNSGSEMEFTRVVFRRNVAYRQGGGFMCFHSNEPLWFRGAIFANNRAVVGGGIAYVTGGNLTLLDHEGFPSQFINNLASVGAGIYYEEGHIIFVWILMDNVLFRGNRAVRLTERRIERLRQLEESIELLEMAATSDYASGPLNQTDPEAILSYMTEIPGGHGGGMCLVVLGIRLFTYAEIYLRNVRFEENGAMVGGGMSIHMKDHHWNNGTERFVFENVTITNNKAIFAGGLFTTNARKILLTCDRIGGAINTTLQNLMLSQINPSGNLQLSAEDYCTRIENNSIADRIEIEGGDVGSSADSLVLLNDFNSVETLTSGMKLELPCGSNEGPQCHGNIISVAVKDAFNQTIVRGISDAELEVIVIPDHVLGDLRYTAKNGIIQVDNLRVWGIDVGLNLTIQHEDDDQIMVQTEFQTRSCRPGEYSAADECNECPLNRYSFTNTTKRCTRCEEHAICSGGAALVPIPGYWHSTPFSPQFHRCFLREACDFTNRSKELEQFYKDHARVESSLAALDDYVEDEGKEPEFEDYEQCAEGYDGILCGSCEEDFGRSFNGECRQCPDDKSMAAMLAFLAVFWTFLIIAANCAITLASTRARIHLVLFELEKQSTINRRPVLARAVHIQNSDPQPSLERQMTISTQPSDLSEPEYHQIIGRQLVATVQLTETLKILVNYLQVTSAALRLQIEWAASLNGLLSLLSAFVGFGSQSLDAPFECNFDNDRRVPPSIIALWLRILTPSMVLCALIIVFTGLWYLCLFYGWKPLEFTSKRDTRSTRQSWLTCVIVITTVTVYFSYIDITRDFLRTVNCVQVDEDESESTDKYQKYAIATGDRIWAEDTAMVCFKGDHRGTGIAGIFGLIFAFIVVIFIIVWLPLNHRHRKDPHFIARYWFIYQAYKRDWYTSWWEAAILIRKAMIATIVVYSFHLGPNLQAVLCVGVLIAAYTFQTTFRPFKIEEEHEYVPDYFGVLFKWIKFPKLGEKWIKWNNSVSLNGLESASLISSIVVYFIGLTVSDSNSSSVGMSVLAAIGFLLNGVYLCYMFFRLYAGLHVMLDWRLELVDSAFMATEPNGSGIVHLVIKAYRLARAFQKKTVLTNDGNSCD